MLLALAPLAMTAWSAHGIGVSVVDVVCNLAGGSRLLLEVVAAEPELSAAAGAADAGDAADRADRYRGQRIAAIPIAVLAARPIAPNRLAWLLDRNAMNVLRTLPDLFWAMLFATAVGFGPLAGALALAVFTVAVVGKLFSESLESVDLTCPKPCVRPAAAGCRRCACRCCRRLGRSTLRT